MRSEEIIVVMKGGKERQYEKCIISPSENVDIFCSGITVYDLSIFKDRNGSSDLPHFFLIISISIQYIY